MENDERVNIRQFPDDILLAIFGFLSVKDIVSVALTCKEWWRVAQDDFLWKDFFFRDWKIKKGTTIAGGKSSWKEEYKRLVYHTPCLQCQELKYHKDQVLHVSFSNNGQMFATCSKDGTCKVWTSDHPCKLLFKYNMKQFHWKYTQFSQFNKADTLLLVSGVHFGENSTSGEIAVFSIVDNFELQCRMINKPYDIFGTWYNDTHLLSGSLYWTGQLNSCSALWLNMVLASQAIETENESVVMRLFKFLNENASSIRTIMIANCYNDFQRFLLRRRMQTFKHIKNCARCHEKYLEYLPTFEELEDMNSSGESEKFSFLAEGMNDFDEEELRHLPQYNAKAECSRKSPHGSVERTLETDEAVDTDTPCASTSKTSRYSKSSSSQAPGVNGCSTSEESTSCDNYNIKDAMLSDSDEYLCDKLLIFTLGSETYTPHQIGLKRIQCLELENNKQKHTLHGQILPEVSNNNHGINRTYDKVDKVLEMAGHIIGMSLSPDNRYLYVNCRPWPENYKIEKPLEPPPLAQEIDIHVIDLYLMEEVGTMLRSHKAYTANDECFFIFLDVSDEYVASGAEDKHGYMWDRHYGICLNKFQHDDVVNSVAFNPVDPEMLVTVSDDYTIKVWRSKHWFHQQGKIS